ncbi:solute carrier family 28 member 3 isoform X2 [Drosophila willistoni]|uniref:solute carrier family 28 member 3 isoform X2 n=1 Tax=Drosophila willistoni TaxID=7260 RepID=UPI000C26C85C|nr:solute carrier family 28 member 3 isoform X2 [Drosophila willistoni]
MTVVRVYRAANPTAAPAIPPPETRYRRQVDVTTAPDAKKKPFEPNLLCSIDWCHGYGFFGILFVIFYIFWIYYWLVKPLVGKKLYGQTIEPAVDKWISFSRGFAVSLIMVLLVIILVVGYLLFECRNDFRKSAGLVAPLLFVFLGFLCSKHRRVIQWRIVIHGILGQLILGIICIRLEFGRSVFKCIGDKVSTFLLFANHGARFVYGDRICDDFVFAFAILAMIFFFSVATSCLYYLGIMQFFLGVLGWLLQATVGTTVCESINAVGTVFLGMSESPLLIRPYIPLLTVSELHTICVSGYSNVAGTVLGAYIAFGAPPGLLITASVMAAPASLAFAKLFFPETEESVTRSDNIVMIPTTNTSILDAIISGAAGALTIVLGIVSNIIAFLSLFAFLNAVTEWIFDLLGFNQITLVYLLTYLFVPLVFAMGVPTHDCKRVGELVAQKTFINEFTAYKNLGQMIEQDLIDQRSAGIATFALCGFSNPASLGILIAALSAMAPNRRTDIMHVALRGFFVGSFVSFTSASFAGILIQENELQKMNTKMIDFQYLNTMDMGLFFH